VKLSFQIALWIERWFGDGNHVWCWRAKPCSECRKPTHWLEVNYGCRLHQGTCTDVVDDEYERALSRPVRPPCATCDDMGVVELPELLPCPECRPVAHKAEREACGLES
jgi:hypothetical protein